MCAVYVFIIVLALKCSSSYILPIFTQTPSVRAFGLSSGFAGMGYELFVHYTSLTPDCLRIGTDGDRGPKGCVCVCVSEVGELYLTLHSRH